MKKLNNKGITTVEVLICFVLIVTITVSIYATVSSFNERKAIESYKEKIYSYKNLLTKEMQDDFIKKGLTGARYEKDYYYYTTDDLTTPISEEELQQINAEREEANQQKLTVAATNSIYRVYCTLKDGTERVLEIEQLFAKSSYHLGGSAYIDDHFVIRYGTPDDMIDWDLPDVGYYGYDASQNDLCDFDTSTSGYCRKIQNLSINNVIINITDDNILSIYIGFYHPDFATRYAISVIAPINYVANDNDFSNSWEY